MKHMGAQKLGNTLICICWSGRPRFPEWTASDLSSTGTWVRIQL